MTYRIGSLFSGAGGLDMAVEQVFGGHTVWHSEIDAAASKVLAHRWPEVPNLGDISAVDWTTVPPVDILCGGFPCQDVSAAGMRRGLKDGTRSGLWSVFATAIDALRPPLVVIENVRGLLSATAHRNLESDDPVMGDGSDRPVLRALGAVLGDLAEIGYDAQWTTVAAADIGAPHRRERVFIVAHALRGSRIDGPARGLAGDSGEADSGPVELLPTPCAQQSGNTPENHLRKKPGRKVVTDLAILVENGLLESGGALLPTPVVTDSSDSARHTIVGGTSHPGTSLTDAIRLLPTPNASDSLGGGSHPDRRVNADGLKHGRSIRDYALLHNTDRWGKYAPAIARWEALTRPAPAPTEPNKNGNPRLSAAFSEWLMGWPAGWVTDPDIGISRNDQLRIVGNGVCPQQATAALTWLLQISEVAA